MVYYMRRLNNNVSSTMSREQARALVQNSPLSPEDQNLWLETLHNQSDETVAAFVREVGNDTEVLVAATQFLKARKQAGDVPAGSISNNEYDLFMEMAQQEQ